MSKVDLEVDLDLSTHIRMLLNNVEDSMSILKLARARVRASNKLKGLKEYRDFQFYMSHLNEDMDHLYNCTIVLLKPLST